MTKEAFDQAQEKILQVQKDIIDLEKREESSFRKTSLCVIFAFFAVAGGPVLFAKGRAHAEENARKSDTRSIQMQWIAPKTQSSPLGAAEYGAFALFALGIAGMAVALKKRSREENEIADMRDEKIHQVSGLKKELQDAWLSAGCPTMETMKTPLIPTLLKKSLPPQQPGSAA